MLFLWGNELVLMLCVLSIYILCEKEQARILFSRCAQIETVW